MSTVRTAIVASGWDAPQFAVLGAAFIGAAGATAAGWWASSSQTRAQRSLAIRQSRAEAYREILRCCYQIADWCSQTMNMWVPDANPTMPSEDELREAQVLAALYGPIKVNNAFVNFYNARQDFWIETKLIEDEKAKADSSRLKVDAMLGRLEPKRQEIFKLLSELAFTMHREVALDQN